MTSLPSNTTLPRRRAQVVADAVVSAYINEIAAPARPRARAVATPAPPAPIAVVHRTPAPRPELALELAA